MITIYVLKCGNGKYYVGKTKKTAMKRYKEHVTGKGCAWTRKYKPTELIECFQGDNFDEDKKTKQYMDKYGIDNVRGGSYSQLKLDQSSIASLKREMNGANDKCNICGKSGHFMRDCPNNFKNFLRSIDIKFKQVKTKHEREKLVNELEQKLKKENRCFRCWGKGHFEKKCCKKKFVNGELIDSDSEDDEVWCCEFCDKKFTTYKGAAYHERYHCHAKKKSKCHRCGRTSHVTHNCYATLHVDGRELQEGY